MLETLETRQLLSSTLLQGISPNGNFGYPRIAFDGTVGSNGIDNPGVNYSATTHVFTANEPLVYVNFSDDPTDADLHLINPLPGVDPQGVLSLTMTADNGGNLVASSPSTNDLVLNGWVDANDDFTPDAGDYIGTATDPLLTAHLTAFGSDFSPADGGNGYFMNYRFTVTGGQLASFFTGQDLGMVMVLTNTDGTPSFSADFSTTAQGTLGPVAPKATPTLRTQANESTSAVGSAQLTDSAVLSGGSSETGSITFSLTAPDGSVVSTQSVPVNGDGTYTTPTAVTATEVGTYTWHATYGGDDLNNAADDDGINESAVVTPAIPSITTTQSAASGTVGSLLMKDTAHLAGGYNVNGGSITFTLLDPHGNVADSETVSVTAGDGDYTTPTGAVATQAGTYHWIATYSGNTTNASVASGANDEPVTVSPTTPSLTTQAGQTGNVVGSATLSDVAQLTGTFLGTGSITFTLTQPDGITVTVGSVPVTGDGLYVSPSVLATEVGAYTWHASYAGDGLNNGAVDNGVNESTTTVKRSPALITTASAGGAVGVAGLTDKAVLSGGYHESGTLTFTLTAPNGATTVESVSVNGDGAYTTPTPVAATQVGTYTWTASYSGDGLNLAANDQGGAAEQAAITKASPSLATVASESGSVVGTATLSDKVIVTGGYNPTGTVTFTLKAPDGTTASTQTVTINGDGSYTVPTPVLATQVGTYTWSASYAGDSLNSNAVDPGGTIEQVSTTKTSPSVVTTASATGSCQVNTATTSDSAVLAGGYNAGGTITFVLTAPDGTIASTQSVAIHGNGTYGTSAVLATQVGTYTWAATYNGDTLNGTAKDQGGAAEQVKIVAPPGGTISGTKFQDLTGNGFSADDTPLGGVTIDLFKDNGSGTFSSADAKVASAVTAKDGTYSFTNLAPGLYFVQEEVPTGWVATGTPLVYSIQVSAGTNATGKNFDDFQEECDLTKFSCIYYIINGCEKVTELSGNVQPGDEVTAYATVAPHYSDELTLVSYIAPDNYWNANDASQQVIYDSKTVSFSTGNSPQTICIGPVQIPLEDYQIDFVCGPAINQLGNGSSNAQYHPQNRFIDSSNSGNRQGTTTNSDISGIAFCDANLDGTLDNCEDTISGATVYLETTGGKVLATTTTGANGSYSFENLAPATYLVVISPPNGDVAETAGGNQVTVTLPSNQNGQTNPMGNVADLNFAELCHCSAIEGCAWDDCNNDGKVDFNECGIINVPVTLTGYDCFGNKVTLQTCTDDTGCYSFTGLLPGCYTVSEGQPGGFTQGNNSCGTVNGSTCGSKSGTDTFCNIQISDCGDAGEDYDFGEHCTSSVCKGAAASTAFWKGTNGQALLKKLNGSANSYALGTWLATMFPNTYSNVLVSGKRISFASLTNSQIASYFVTNDYNVNSAKLNTQVLATAFNCYATSTTLAGGNYAASYGFTTSANGTGYDTINVGSNGAAFGVANNSTISVLQALNATDNDALNGVLYATSEVVSGVTYSATTLQNMALTVYTSINNAGGINS